MAALSSAPPRQRTRGADCRFVAVGEWRGLEVAIKTVIFQSDESDNTMSRLASEAAIASNLSHPNVVAMYSHDICTVSSDACNELDIYKFYLIQVRPTPHSPPLRTAQPPHDCPALA